MTPFKTPLPRLLADTLTHAMQEMIRVDVRNQATHRITILEGRAIALCLTGVGINLIFSGRDGLIWVKAEPPQGFDTDSVDTTITGTPEALLAMAVPDWSQANASVRIEGDAQAAQALEQLLRQLDPDWERLLVERFGLVIGHQLYGLFRRMIETGQRASETGLGQLSEYLQHESGWLVDRSAFDDFTHAVDELSEAIDRLRVNAQRRGWL